MIPIQPNEINQLAPMSASVNRLARIVADPESNLSAVTRLIELDEALTVNVLRWANSAWSRGHHAIVTIKEAVIRLGGASILKMAVGEHVTGSLNKAVPAYELDEKELWRHSVAAALAAESLHLFTKETISGVAFTAALIHDIGKLVLNRHMGSEVIKRIRKHIENDRITYIEAEFKVLGTDHAKIGGLMARHWQFPELLIHAIEHHHDPDIDPDPLLDAVHISNLIAKLIGEGLGSEQMNMKASTDSARRLGLSSAGLESLCAHVQAELQKAESVWEGR